MSQVLVLINCPSRYKINRRLAREVIVKALKDCGLRRPSEISLMVVGNRKMRQLNQMFRKVDQPTSILAFPLAQEGEPFYYPPDGTTHLGDLVISYPQLIKQAAKENMMVDSELRRLLKHGVQNLLRVDKVQIYQSRAEGLNRSSFDHR